MNRILILFLPSLCGLFWKNDPGISISWSLAGSLFIAIIAQTQWFIGSTKNLPVSHRLLRPLFMYQLFFVGFNVLGGGFYFANSAGYSSWKEVGSPSVFVLSPLATAQELMLLAHAGVTAGMKLVGFQYDQPKYHIPYVPPYSLVLLSFGCLGVGTVFGFVPGLQNLGQKLLQCASTAILVEITFAVAQRNFQNLIVTFSLLFLNLLSQVLSGWKGLVLWTMITLGALLYPMMPRRVLLGGCTFGLFWLLVLHPFGLAFRPLIWQQGLDRENAVNLSMEKTFNMSLEERLDNVWTVLVERASELYQFEKYLDYVPHMHPYFGLDLVKEATIGLVPKIIWPEKPALEPIAMKRVYEAGIVSETTNVSAKSNFYQDAYLSWGWIAVIMASLIFGSMIMIISQIAERLFGGYEIGTCLIFTSLFGDVVQSPPNFLFLAGSVCSSLIVMYAAFFIGRTTRWILPATNMGFSSVR